MSISEEYGAFYAHQQVVTWTGKELMCPNTYDKPGKDSFALYRNKSVKECLSCIHQQNWPLAIHHENMPI